MQLDQLHHVAILVSDYKKSKDFYVNKLGFEIIREHHRPERLAYKLDLKLGNMELEIFGPDFNHQESPVPPKRPNYPEACGLRHLAFYVTDIDKTIEELNKEEIITEPIREDTFTGKRLTFFFDPDGLPIELHE